ncbi:MAG: hypothetical protein F6K40_33560 [Okeania sp. SIO3I5]|uniref:hypothetical protein n=1 Tax=Okeania sp. SIO3I5 TaxID=2607805 RepID=UPI0013BB4D85|nr:hypothetical protein [Okeania sp. SIO3I5]NEQ40882.1 hypothetical protein [Okeania sp. SIO3I5]
MNKPKKFYLPKWFPFPRALLKALIRVSFMTILVTIIRDFELGVYFGELLGSLELLVCLSIVILFFLIPILAFAHNFLILLFHTIRETFSKRYRYKLFLFPRIISWWKALYSWLVIIISTLAAILISTLILPWFNLNYTSILLEKSKILYPESLIDKLLFFVFISIWLIVAAKLYQFEFVSKSFFLLRQTNHRTQAQKYKINQTHQIQHQINLNKTNNELAKSSIFHGINHIAKPLNLREQDDKKKLIYPQNNLFNKLPKILKDNILVLLIIALLGLGVYGFSRSELVSETPVVVVTEILSPIPKKVNSEKPEITEVKTKPTPLSSPTKKSASIPTKTIIVPKNFGLKPPLG